MNQTTIVAGRSVADYILCGKPVPSGAVLIPCEVCGEVLAFSAEAALRIERGGHAACSTCVTEFMDSTPRDQTRVEMSAQGKAQPFVVDTLKKKGWTK